MGVPRVQNVGERRRRGLADGRGHAKEAPSLGVGRSIGIPMSTIKDAFGHSSIKVTERYVSTPREGLKSAMDQVDAVMFGTPATEGEPERTETETETALGLLTFYQVMGAHSR